MKMLKLLFTLLLTLLGAIALYLLIACVVYTPTYVYRTIVWRDSDAFDWQKFPNHPLQPSATPYHFPEAPDPRVEQLFERLSGAEDWGDFLAVNHTQAFIVIRDGTVVYENYFNGAQRDSLLTSFSAAKSFTSALIGIALQEGYIHSVDDPITAYLPELAARNPDFERITVRHILRMSSGFEYVGFRPLLFNSDDILTSYYPDQRKISLENTYIIEPPGLHFSYNKYHPQLLGMILERTTGMPVTTYLQTRLWDKIGMEYPGSWSTDSKKSDFERMETGVNARALDYAKFGVLFLNGGAWQGEQVISTSWVEESTGPYLPENYSDYYSEYFQSLPGKAYYQYLWWGMARPDGSHDFSAEGDKGQFIYISPQHNLVIVRNGIEYGIPTPQWMDLFYEFASQYK
jgi:CubicO group peptidase (beta-lactamase class C family)